MRKLIICCVLILSATLAFCQTSLDEYNYVTKGYQFQKESGLDMKKGYELSDSNTTDFLDPGVIRTFKFKKLIRLWDKKVCAIMVEYTLRVNQKDNTIYFCIPMKNSSPEIWAKVAQQLRTFNNPDLSTAYNWALIQFITNNIL